MINVICKLQFANRQELIEFVNSDNSLEGEVFDWYEEKNEI
jgi:hypothetical protein